MLEQVGIHNGLKVTLPLKRNCTISSISGAQVDHERPPLTSYSSLAIVSRVSAALSRNQGDSKCCDFGRARE